MNFRQRQVKTALASRARLHRRAEASRSGLRAVDRDDERRLAPLFIDRVDVRSAQKDPVLDVDRRQLAGTHAKESVTGGIVSRRPHVPTAVDPVSRRHLRQRRKQVSLPGMGADDEPKAGFVVATLESITSRLLPIGPTSWEIVDRTDLVVDNRTLIDCRPDDLKTVLDQMQSIRTCSPAVGRNSGDCWSADCCMSGNAPPSLCVR